MTTASIYYIVECRGRGTLRDLEETPKGNIGRFSREGSRADEATAARFRTPQAAFKAIDEITPINRREDCQVRSSYEPGTYLEAWPIIERDTRIDKPPAKRPNEHRTFVTSTPILVQADSAAEAQAKFSAFVDALAAGELDHDGSGRFDGVVLMEDNSSFEELED